MPKRNNKSTYTLCNVTKDWKINRQKVKKRDFKFFMYKQELAFLIGPLNIEGTPIKTKHDYIGMGSLYFTCDKQKLVRLPSSGTIQDFQKILEVFLDETGMTILRDMFKKNTRMQKKWARF